MAQEGSKSITEAEILAFQSADPIESQKSWGRQNVRAGGWVIVPLTEDGERGVLDHDLHGAGADYEKLYVPGTGFKHRPYVDPEQIQRFGLDHETGRLAVTTTLQRPVSTESHTVTMVYDREE